MANPKSQQFKLTKAHISADRFGGFDKKFFDVKSQVAEINIYESIEELSLTGTIAIVDDKSLYELINFNGTERIKLEMAGLGKDTDPVFEKTFIMTNIVKQLKGNDKSSIYVFDIIDEHGFISEAETEGIQDRVEMQQATISDISSRGLANNLFGYGHNNYGIVRSEIQQTTNFSPELRPTGPHNSFLFIILDYGFVGLLLFICIY